MIDDDDVLLENDPLTIYLKNQQLGDFEVTKIHSKENIEQTLVRKTEDIKLYPEFQIYSENFLKCELLLEEDYNILHTYYSNDITPSRHAFSRKLIFTSSLSILSVILLKYCNLRTVKFISPLCAVPIAINLYEYAKQKLKNRRIYKLLQELSKLTNTVKKCLKLVGEFSATIGYYSSETINSSSINNIYIRFAKQFYAILLNIVKLLACSSSQIINIVPLSIDSDFKYGIKEDLFLKDEINISDLKLLFELYLLVQSDFIKTFGLSFCSYLWLNPNCDFNKLLDEIIPKLSTDLNEKSNSLNNEYNILRNYGASTTNFDYRSPKKFDNAPSNYISSCLHNAEIHFQQLLCKSKDLQDIVSKTELDKQNEKTELISTLLNEMEKQMTASKNMLETVTKYFNQLQNKSSEHEDKVTVPRSTQAVKTVENQEEELAKQEKLTYELYIPKEGLDLTELEVDTQRSVFSIKNLDYSGVLLQELRTILKARNPDVFEENTAKPETLSESESEEEFHDYYKRKNVFRPEQQPVGLAENLQTISHVLAARRNILHCEEICGDSSEPEDCCNEN